MARRSDRILVRTLASALVGLLALTLLRAGLFDFSRPPAMRDDPCAAGSAPSDMLRGDGERQRLADWGGLCHFRQDNARLRAAAARPQVVMIGDSITALWREADPAFFGDTTVVDRGISGHTSAQMLLRFQQDVVELRPRTVHILAGLNDIAGNTAPASPGDFEANIRAMAAIARANGIVVVLGEVPPAREFYWRKGIDPRGRIAQLNRRLAALAAQEGLVLAEYHRALAAPSGAARPEFDRDGVHLTPAAYRAMRPLAEAAFARAEAGKN